MVVIEIWRRLLGFQHSIIAACLAASCRLGSVLRVLGLRV